MPCLVRGLPSSRSGIWYPEGAGQIWSWSWGHLFLPLPRGLQGSKAAAAPARAEGPKEEVLPCVSYWGPIGEWLCLPSPALTPVCSSLSCTPTVGDSCQVLRVWGNQGGASEILCSRLEFRESRQAGLASGDKMSLDDFLPPLLRPR